MNDTRDVTQDREEYVDQQVGTTPALQEDSKGRDKNSKKDFADVRTGERHLVQGRGAVGECG